MPSSGRAGIQHPLLQSEESRANRVLGRIATNPLTWLQHQVDKTKGVSPETIVHVRNQFKRLVRKHGPLKSIPDAIAETEYVRLAYRLNYMRTLEHVLSMKPSDKGYHIGSKTLAVYAAATLKYNGDNGKGGKGQENRKPVPTAATSRGSGAEHDGADEEES